MIESDKEFIECPTNERMIDAHCDILLTLELLMTSEGDPSSVYYVVRDQDQRITAKWAYSPKHKPEWHTTGFENDHTGAKLKSIGDWGRGCF